MSGKEWMTIIIFIIVIFFWIFFNDTLGLGIIAIGGAFLYLATGLVDWKQISRNTNWGVILLFASIISLGVQMKNTGSAIWIGNYIISLLPPSLEQYTMTPYILNILLTTIFSNIMSSSGTVAILGPVTLNMGGEHIMMGIVTAISSSFGYFSAVAAPACMIIYSSGMVKITDFLKAGWRMAIISILTLLIIYKFYWPLVLQFTIF